MNGFPVNHLGRYPSPSAFCSRRRGDGKQPEKRDGRVRLFPYLLELSAARSHEHHRVLSVRVGRHGSHALGAVLVQRVALDDPQASERLVQHQAAEIIADLLWLRQRRKESSSVTMMMMTPWWLKR